MTSFANRRSFKLTVFILCLTIVGFLTFSFISNTRAAVTLESTIPRAGEYLEYTGEVIQVRLVFNGNVKAEGSVIQLIKDRGGEGNLPVPAVVIDPSNPRVAFINVGAKSALGANKYTVNYSIIAADDNTPTTGNYEFYIKPPTSSPIDLGYIFSTPTDAFTNTWYGHNYPPLSIIFFILAVLGTLVGNFFFFYGKYFFKKNLVTYTMINRSSRAIAIASTLGFLFFLCRFGQLQPFNARFFLYVVVILTIVYLFRGIGWFLRTFPKARAEWGEMQARERRKVEKEEEARREKAARAERKQATIAPAVSLRKESAVSLRKNESADAGEEADDADDGEEGDEKSLPAGTAISTRGLSNRGEKRRARKRTNKR
jgi:methionine-rich copper-binding protein CopC